MNQISVVLIGVIRVGVDVNQIDMIPNFRIFAPIFFNIKIILAPSVFDISLIVLYT